MVCTMCFRVCVCAHVCLSLSLPLQSASVCQAGRSSARALVIHRSTLSYTCHMLKKKLMRRGR